MSIPANDPSSPIGKEKSIRESYAPQSPTEAPPSYASIASPSTQRVNHLYISDYDVAIKGTWHVDPNLRIPPPMLPKVKDGERMDNFHIETRDAITSVNLKLESDTPTKSYLYVKSRDRRITVNIISRSNQRFHLTVKNRDSSITVLIPRDFYGPVSYINRDSSTIFSEAITHNLTPLGQQKQSGTAFIGQFEGSGYGKQMGELWRGDELALKNRDAKIWVYYADEEVPPCIKKGFFEKLFRRN